MDEKTLDEVIDELEELREEIGHGQFPVRVAWQPSYPLFAPIAAIAVDQENEDEEAVYLAGGVEGSGYMAEGTAQQLRAKRWQ